MVLFYQHIRTLCFVVLLLRIEMVFAVSEIEYVKINDTILKPFAENMSIEGKLVTEDKETIAYRYYKHPEATATIVILQGWTEHYDGYVEFAYDMYQKKISTFYFDWRGQGRSSRPLPDTYKSHIHDYKEYFKDLDAFLEQVVLPNRKGTLVAMAFSMGANILSLYESVKPGTFERMIMVSPMLDIKTDPFPQWFVWLVAKTQELLGNGSDYIWGQGPFDGTTTNLATSSETRFGLWRKLRKERPETVINGTTWSWMLASLQATWAMREQASHLKAPILMLQAGQDAFVRTGGQDYVCSRALACLKLVFPKSKHAILAENDQIRDKAIREVLDFIQYGY